MTVIIKTDERGLLFKDGSYVGILKPGKHSYFPGARHEVVVCDLNQPFRPANRDLDLFLSDEELKSELEVLDVTDAEIVLRFENGRLKEICRAGQYAYWTVLKKHSFVRIDPQNAEIAGRIAPPLLSHPLLESLILAFKVDSHEKGLLFLNGVFVRLLEPGKHYFLNGPVACEVRKVDLRQLQLDVAGQEIMTQDKITLRLNFICHYRIADPVKAVTEFKSIEEQIYILLQLILREYVGMLLLDELLKKKEELGAYVLSRLKEKSAVYGIEFLFAGVKDIILPGEIKEILNLVLIAEKKAQATIITRREETASTRSLLNTAKLMAENPTLYKLKELEYVERICEKAGNISLLGGNNLLDGLKAVLGLKE